ncbi:MAG: preprotein translocase subunit SecA [Armatimonadetes bacterium]|nr:preprotein translocase subunit SecA [Armatimonadota bacterium]NIM24635.1 preprotein translocase subunit SecA [Armatimonadota bacterium]NIM68514.1 preprotein translocase subunit SecA [Armatimonadota bacterium]NIM76896.1 preprotein translocase subunit SecA [Armatimonadota bacterium]NIN06708.1 preprotein translocase subunit SecA [Armatimonadota bacterium]
MSFLASLWDSTKKDLNRAAPIVERINALEPEIQTLSDEALRAKTEEFRQRLAQARQEVISGERLQEGTEEYERRVDEVEEACLEEILPEAFAVVREAARRSIGMRPFDVQLIGGCVLHWGKIAEMKTGEGKTLVATMPLYLNALRGRGAHLVTHNDYLAMRDAEWMRPVYEFLGMTVGIIQHDIDFDSRKAAYRCDITYATNSEIGFDYLRDNTVDHIDWVVHREMFYAIVDEVDSLLVDEARTPLILAGAGTKPTDLYHKVDKAIRRLVKEIDYSVDEKSRTAALTDEGAQKMEAALGVGNLSDPENIEYFQHANAALRAHACYQRDVHYVVKDGQVIIVDEFTGRLMEGRRYAEGLHQAIEAKEGVKIERESVTTATITYQNLFRLYHKLAGMTGTAKTEEQEFIKVYGLPVTVVPTNRPMIRKDHSDIIYKTVEAKFHGIVAEILQLESLGRPVLVGTRSIEVSEHLSERLRPDKLQLFAQNLLLEDYLARRDSLAEKERIEFRRALSERLQQTRQEASRLEKAVERFETGKLRVVQPEENRRLELRLQKISQLAAELQDLTNKLGSSNGSISGKEIARMGEIVCYQRLEEILAGRIPALLRACGMEADPRASSNITRLAEIIGLGHDPGRLSDLLDKGIPHQVLNAKYHAQEGEIIAQAGRSGKVTIATNMAGRGVDILLGGNPEKLARDLLVEREIDPETAGEEDKARAKDEAERICAADKEKVLSLGGLHILGTERHESRRIDNQLRGRSGRQGDPGSSRFYISFEDELMRLFGPERFSFLLDRVPESEPIEARLTTKTIENAQKKVEAHNFDIRKHRLQYDEVMNRQREVIYAQRYKVLEGADMKEVILDHLKDLVSQRCAEHIPAEVPPIEWKLDTLYESLNEVFPLELYASPEDLEGKKRDELEEFLQSMILQAYADREAETGAEMMRELERMVTLRVINTRWTDHLAYIEYLEEGIHLQGYSGIDPLIIYRKETFQAWQSLLQAIREDIAHYMFRVQIAKQTEAKPARRPVHAAAPQASEPAAKGASRSAPASRSGRAGRAPKPKKVGRNAPCPCGSGRKYKHCCGMS